MEWSILFIALTTRTFQDSRCNYVRHCHYYLVNFISVNQNGVGQKSELQKTVVNHLYANLFIPCE